MDLEYRQFLCLCGGGGRRGVSTASARIRECGSRGYRVEFRTSNERNESRVYPTLAEAKKAVEQLEEANTRALEKEVKRILWAMAAHPWWQARVTIEEMERILETAVIHAEGRVLVDPQGGYAWVPRGTWHRGQHLCLELPQEGHSLASAVFALSGALDEAFQRDCRPSACGEEQASEMHRMTMYDGDRCPECLPKAVP
jgi:hypothetical protein